MGKQARSTPRTAKQARPQQPCPPPRKRRLRHRTNPTFLPEKKTPPLEVNISLVWGGLVNVKTNVAVGARYDGLAFAGSTRAFDRALDSWLSRAVDLGIIGSALGQLFPIDLRQYHMEDRLKAR